MSGRLRHIHDHQRSGVAGDSSHRPQGQKRAEHIGGCVDDQHPGTVQQTRGFVQIHGPVRAAGQHAHLHVAALREVVCRSQDGVVVVLRNDEGVARPKQTPQRRIQRMGGVLHECDSTGISGQVERARQRAAAAKGKPRGFHRPRVSSSPGGAADPLQERGDRPADRRGTNRRCGGVVHVVSHDSSSRFRVAAT